MNFSFEATLYRGFIVRIEYCNYIVNIFRCKVYTFVIAIRVMSISRLKLLFSRLYVSLFFKLREQRLFYNVYTNFSLSLALSE